MDFQGKVVAPGEEQLGRLGFAGLEIQRKSLRMLLLQLQLRLRLLLMASTAAA